MKKYIYIIACAAFAATLHSCSNEVEGVDDTATAITTDDITVAPFPAFGDVQTRSTDAGAGHDKTSWEDGDVIYIQLNGKDSWYAMKYDGRKWSLPDDFPGMYREDTYKAVYAPNYEPSGSSLVLKSGAQPATAEYLTCEGKKPINISFERKYARIRIYTGGVTRSYTATLCPENDFVANDNQGLGEIYNFYLQPDEYGNSYLYGNWGANGAYIDGFDMNLPPSIGSIYYLYVGPRRSYYKFATSSVANKSYSIDISYVTLDVSALRSDEITSWADFTMLDITKIKVIGLWYRSTNVSFCYRDFNNEIHEGNNKITSVDLSEVEGMTYNMPRCFFSYCTSLTEVKLPSDLNDISEMAFYRCSELKKLICYAEKPPYIGYDAFYDTPDDKVVYVPDNSVEEYMQDEDWKEAFGDNIKPLSELSNN